MKIWPAYFDAVVRGEKRFEFRQDDRGGFWPGDVLRLREWRPETQDYTGRETRQRVTYVLELPQYLGGHAILSIAPAESSLPSSEAPDDRAYCPSCGAGPGLSCDPLCERGTSAQPEGASSEAEPPLKGLRRDLSTPENREYWAGVDRIAAEAVKQREAIATPAEGVSLPASAEPLAVTLQQRIATALLETGVTAKMQPPQGDFGKMIWRWHHLLRELLDAIARPPRDAAPPSGTQGWQPIESAPKGSWLAGPNDTRHADYVEPPRIWLLLNDGEPCVGYADAYYAEGGRGYDGGSFWVEKFSGERVMPTHWQPLPSPPSGGVPAPQEKT